MNMMENPGMGQESTESQLRALKIERLELEEHLAEHPEDQLKKLALKLVNEDISRLEGNMEDVDPFRHEGKQRLGPDKKAA